MRRLAALSTALVWVCCAASADAAGTPDPVPAAAPAPQADAPQTDTPALEQVMQLLAARRHGHLAFTEVQTLAMLDRPLESSGELLYDAPDRLEQRTLKPRPQTLTLENGVLTAARGRRTHTVELAAHPQLAPLIEGLRATLAGDRAALERIFVVKFGGDPADWTLQLTPRDPAALRIVSEVRIAGSGAALKSVQILQADGDHALITLGPELDP